MKNFGYLIKKLYFFTIYVYGWKLNVAYSYATYK